METFFRSILLFKSIKTNTKKEKKDEIRNFNQMSY